MNHVSKAYVARIGTGFQLYVNDEPFYIHGAGLEFGKINELAEHGANSFRTWRVENGRKTGKEVLDEAHRLGLKVMMGIEVARERHGFDYDDHEEVKKQLERIKQEVLDHKDHPALIIWGIGNELNLHSTNPKVWDAVNDISKMIHEIDPYHLTTTSLAGFDQELAAEMRMRVPDIDILSIQLYGEVVELPKIVKKLKWEVPIIVSEWGPTGYWEAKKTEWGAPVEDNSTVKAGHYLDRYKASMMKMPTCIGSYAFLWGQKQERTSTWFGMYTEDGRKTEAVDAMHYIWNEDWPENRCLMVESMTLNGLISGKNIRLKSEEEYPATIRVSDEAATFRWEVLRESEATEEGGDDEEVPEKIEGLIRSGDSSDAIVKAPKEKGAYRLYVYAEDEHDHTAHANIPFLVI